MSNENSTKLVGEVSIWAVILWVTIILGAMIFVSMSGCSILQRTPNPTYIPPTIITKTIQSTDWLTSVFLISIVLSIFIGLNNLKIGWLAAIAGVAGLVLKMGVTNSWLWVVAGVFCCVVFGVLVFTIIVRNKALKEIIKGTQWIRDNISGGIDKQTTSKMLDKTQSQSTKNIVKEVKKTL